MSRRRRLVRSTTRSLRLESLENRRLLAVFNVTTLDDEPFHGAGATATSEAADGTGLSLREAIGLANQNDGGIGQGDVDNDIITFASGLSDGTLNLNLGNLFIGDDILIDGSAGSATERVTIDAGGVSRILVVDTLDGLGSDAAITLANLVLTRAASPDGPGGAIQFFGVSLSLYNVDITMSIADSAGAIQAAGEVTISGGTISANTARADGGGLFLASGSMTITGSTIVNNTAGTKGGGIFADAGTVSISNSTIDFNRAAGDSLSDGGGGIFNNGAAVTITGTTIGNNEASGRFGSGGGISSSGRGSVSITDSTVSGNMAAGDGGGLYAAGNGGTVNFSSATFSANVTGDAGGGALIDGPVAKIASSSFTGNQALGSATADDGVGGGLFIGGDLATGRFEISDTLFERNTALGGGGGLYVLNVDGTVTGGGASANQVTGNGNSFETGSGGIAIVGAGRINSVDITGVTVEGNSAPSAGGIGVVDAIVTIDNSNISKNTATEAASGGGGIGAIASTSKLAGEVLTLTRSSVADNVTAGEGGGVGVINGNVLITDTMIEGNRADGGRGGGVGIAGAQFAGTATIRNTTLASNRSSAEGGGIAALNSGLILENVTVSANDAGTFGGGIANENDDVTLTSSISFSTITSNTSLAAGSNLATSGAPIDVAGSIFSNGDIVVGASLNSLGGNLDSGNSSGFSQPTDLLNTDPLLGPLQDNDGPVFTHALLTGSPAIDAGPATGPAGDARGMSRPQDGDGNGSSIPDIGAFEGAQAGALRVDDVNVDEDAGVAAVTVRLLAATVGGFTVDIAASDGTATQTNDYTAATETLTFTGTMDETRVFSVQIANDDVVEFAETINITLSNPSNSSVDASDTAVVTIVDNDTATLSMADVIVDESVGAAIVTVMVDRAVQGGFSVDFAVSDDTAVSPYDYASTIGSLSFAGSANESQTISVPIIDDTTVEPREVLTVALNSPSVAAVDASAFATIEIDDNDTALLTIDNVTVDESAGTATGFGDSSIELFGPLLINLPLVGGGGILDGSVLVITDDAGNDVIFEFNLIGTAAQISGAITVPFNTFSTVDQVANALILEINAAGLGIAASHAEYSGSISLGRIDETRVNLGEIPDPNDPTRSIPGVAATGVTLRRWHPADGEWLTLGEGATTVTFEFDDNIQHPGTQSNHVAVPSNPLLALGDVAVGLAGAINASSLAVSAIAELDGNNDPTGRVLLSGSADLAIDGGAAPSLIIDSPGAAVTVTLTGAVAGGLSVDLATGDLTAAQPSDYLQTSTTLVFAGDDQERRTVTIPIVDDNILEKMEQFSVALANLTTLGGSPAPVASIDAASAAVVSITEAPSTQISGTVYCDIDSDGVHDPGEQLADAVVFLDANDNGRLDVGEPQTTTDADGLFGFNKLSAGSSRVIVAVPGNSNCNTITDEPSLLQPPLAVGDLARSIVSADVDNDGDLDLLVAADLSHSLTILENTANGFTRGTDIILGDRPQSVFAFDSGAGPARQWTVAVAGVGTAADGGAVYTIDGNGGSPVRHAARGGPIDVIVDDFDGDGAHDVLSASLRESLLELRMGDSSEVQVIDSLTSQIISIASGNLDNDGSTQEVVVAGYGYKPDPVADGLSTKLEVFQIDSAGRATKFASIDAPPEAVQVSIADVIGNDPLDVFDDFVEEIVLLLHTGKIQVYPIVGGVIGSPIETEILAGATAFDLSDRVTSTGELLDFNGDGEVDLAVAHVGGRPTSEGDPLSNGFVELFTGTGDGRFALVSTIQSVAAPSDLVIDDFTGDGIAEVAIANLYSEADVSQDPAVFSLPSAVTIMELQFSSRDVVVADGSATTADFPFRNADPELLLDTNGDGDVTALDGLRVLNLLGRRHSLEGEQAMAPVREATDVNGDGYTTAIDALLIFNHLGRQQSLLGEASQALLDELLTGDDDDDERDDALLAIDRAFAKGLGL